MAKRRGPPKKKAVEKAPSEEKEIVKDLSDEEVEEKSSEKLASDLDDISDDEQLKTKTPSKGKRGRSSAKQQEKREASPEAVEEEDDEIENQSTSKKKGKGRPKKSTSAAKGKKGKPSRSSEKTVVEQSDEDEEERKPLKRGRSSAMNSGSESEGEVPVAKSAKKGKPSKNVQSDSEEEEVKKKPGKKGRPASKKKVSDEVDGEKKQTKRGKPSAKAADGESESEEEALEYEVDRIMDVQFLKNGKREFLIKWKGYSKDDSTWEPESHLDCQDLLDAFMSKLDDNDVSRPRRLSARPSTMMQTRASESRSDKLLNSVQKGRINKYERRSSVSSSRSFGEVQYINKLKNGGKLTTISEHPVRNRRQRSYRGTIRAVILSCGMVASLSAALLYSSSSSLNWDSVSLQAQEVINQLREKVEVLYHSAVEHSKNL